MPHALVVDASALVDYLTGQAAADAIAARFDGHDLHAPSHIDLEVLSGIGRMHRAGQIPLDDVPTHLRRLSGAPMLRHDLRSLLAEAWALRHHIQFADGLYVALAERLGLPLVTTDARLARAAPVAELVTA